ncbi:MAG TPA: choice-of-anchor Q domain-containing protein [Anaerolineae bacterium]|nr:choice-of-anchor Q domain-containing protein [Anaerolineae bacterium]
MNTRIVRFLFGATIALAAALSLRILPMPALTRAAPSTTFIVNSNADAPDATLNGVCETGNGNGICTLRAAITEANAASGSTIVFGQQGSLTYLLTLGELNITANVKIVGNGSANTIIDGNGSVTNSRVFDISSSSLVVNMTGVTIRNGKANQGGGINNLGKLSLSHSTVRDSVAAAIDPRSGGGIYNTGILTVTNSFINDNSAPNVSFTGGGGGIYNSGGTVVLINSTLNSNSTNSTGGAIQVDGGTVSLVNSMVNSNIANYGGGIFNGGTLNITQSGIYSNTASNSSFSGGGGGIDNFNGVATIYNSTIYLNVANRDGGGIGNESSGTLYLYNVTVAGNYSDWDGNNTGVGGGIYQGGGSVNFRNTILAGNYNWSNSCITCSTPDDCAGTLNSEDYNLIQTTSGCTLNAPGHDITGVDPQLSYPPHFNGGPTLNLALLPGSPAIDAGNTGGCRDGLGALIPTDQRGFPRPANGGVNGLRCDIGAYEWYRFGVFLPLIRK